MSSLRYRAALGAAAGGLLGTLPLALLAIARTDLASWPIWGALVAGMLLGAGLGWIAGERQSREIEALRETVTSAANGDLSALAEPATVTEINELARSVNRLIARFVAAEHRNAQEQRWVEAIFDGMQDGIMVVDADERVIAANVRSGELLGQYQEIREGERLMVLTRDHELVEQFREVMESASQRPGRRSICAASDRSKSRFFQSRRKASRLD